MNKHDQSENDRLREENKRLCKKIKKLEREIYRLHSDAGIEKSGDSVSKLWNQRHQFSSAMTEKSYPRYSAKLLKSTSAWGLASKGIKYFRRFKLLSTLFRWITRLIALAESGVALVASLSVFIVALPFVLILSLISLFAALFRGRSMINEMRKKLDGKKIYILFAEKEQIKRENSEKGYFYSNAKDLASEGSSVIMVSPFFFSKKGFEKKNNYVTAREERENIFLVRKIFFFILRRKVIEKTSCDYITIF